MYVSTSGEYWRRNCISACSCATILSTTRLSVAGCWAAAASGNAPSARATGKMFRIRIMSSKAVGYEYSLVLAGYPLGGELPSVQRFSLGTGHYFADLDEMATVWKENQSIPNGGCDPC